MFEQEEPSFDLRTYYVTDGCTTTIDRFVGHHGFPCPPTRGEVATCEDAWDHWMAQAPVHLVRARTYVRPRLGPLVRDE